MRLRIFHLLITLLLCGCSLEKIEREVGHMGEARRNPFLAAQRFLKKREFLVETITRFTNDIDSNGTLITPAQSFINYGMTEQTLEWVNNGGHLVVFLRGGEAFRNDWLGFTARDLEEPEEEMVRLLDALGIDGVESAQNDASGEVLGRKVTYDAHLLFKWKNGKQPVLSFSIGDPAKPAAASFARGDGHVTIIASARPFRNRYIGDGDHAWIFWLLTTHRETAGVWFLQGVKLSFFSMLWERGWMGITALLALIAAWLWRHIPRFGPMSEAPQSRQRDFASHIGVIGAYHWSHRSIDALLGPLREAVVRGAVRRGLQERDAEFTERLATSAGLPPERVQDALKLAPHDSLSLLTIMQDLHRIATTLRL